MILYSSEGFRDGDEEECIWPVAGSGVCQTPWDTFTIEHLDARADAEKYNACHEKQLYSKKININECKVRFCTGRQICMILFAISRYQ